MTLYIHFTKNANDFDLSISDEDHSISNEMGCLFVYKYHEDFPTYDKSVGWGGRDAILIETDGAELYQTDPIGCDSNNDEYIIPSTIFNECTWWKIDIN